MLSFRLGNLNCRSLRSDARLAELESAFNGIEYDVCGLTEVNRNGTESLELQQSGHQLPLHGKTGFLIHPKWTPHVSFHPRTDRVSYLDIQHQKFYLRLVCLYAPTSTYADEEYEECLDNVVRAMKSPVCNRVSRKKICKVVLGNMNAKVGSREDGETFIREHELGDRNERGQMLSDFCHENELFCLNTWFHKRLNRKWTWLSPNMETKNCIDFFLCKDKKIFKDVGIVATFPYTSDHRLVMSQLQFGGDKRHTKSNTRSTLNKRLFSFAMEQLSVNRDLTQYEALHESLTFAAEVASVPLPKVDFQSTRTKDEEKAAAPNTSQYSQEQG